MHLHVHDDLSFSFSRLSHVYTSDKFAVPPCDGRQRRRAAAFPSSAADGRAARQVRR